MRLKTSYFSNIFLILQLLIFIGFSQGLAAPLQSSATSGPYDYSFIRDDETRVQIIANVMDHIAYFAQLGSRVTGYPGCEEAANYVAQKFEEYGLTPGGQEGYFDYYNVTVPIDRGATVTILSSSVMRPSIKAYALWPNNIQACPTPPEGITGRLLYLRDGSLSELSEQAQRFNITLEDAVIIMEFNTLNRWINAVKFGAKAIIFIEPEDTNRMEAQNKFLLTPLNIPRLYVLKEDGQLLRSLAESGTYVRVDSSMRYETVAAKNVIGVIEGSRFKDDIIVLSSYYDGWSIVPSIAPAADEASGIATLLELARFFKLHPPVRTVWFVAFSGHWEALAGSRDFVETHYFDPEVQANTKRIWMQINLDISTDSSTLAYVPYGTGYTDPYFAGFFDAIFPIFQRDIPNALEAIGFNATKYIHAHSFPSMASYFFHDAEPTVVAGSCAFTYRTSLSQRLHYCTPLNTIGKVNPVNLEPQLIYAFTSSYTFAQLDSLPLAWDESHVKPARRFVLSGLGGGVKGYAGVIGDVVRYDPQSRWYTFQGLEDYDVLIDLTIVSSRYNPFMQFIYKVDSDGRFIVKGVGTDFIYPEAGGQAAQHYVGAIEPGESQVRVKAYAVNRTTGAIEWATDFGVWSWPQNRGFVCDRDDGWKDVRISVFKSETIVLYDLLDPETLRPPWIDMNWYLSTFDRLRFTGFAGSNYFPSPLSVEVRDFYTHGLPVEWGLLTHSTTMEPITMIFLPEDFTFEVLIRKAGSPVGLLINANEANPEGEGYKILKGESTSIYVPLQSANDVYWLSHQRLDMLRRYAVFSFFGDQALTKAGGDLAWANESLNTGDYGAAHGLSLFSWTWGLRSYMEGRYLIYSLTFTFMFFGVLLVPFALLSERLFVPTSGRRRIMIVALCYVIPFLIFTLVHPGHQLALNIPIAVEAVMLIFFSAIVVLMFVSEIGGFLKQLRAKVVGLHFTEISRTSAFLMALSSGIQQMRRRRFRTTLTMATLVSITLSMIMLTSATGTIVSSRVTSTPRKVTYIGMLIENDFGVREIGDEVIQVARSLYGSKAVASSRRAWIYPPPLSTSEFGRPFWRITSETGTYDIWAVLGLDPQEVSITNYDLYLTSGRSFATEDYTVCILSENASEALGISVGAEIIFSELRLRVVGIVQQQALDEVADLNGYSISPIDFTGVQLQYQGASIPAETLRYLSVSTRTPFAFVIIIPFKLARDVFNSPMRNFAVKIEDVDFVERIADEMTLAQGSLSIFVGDPENGRIYFHSMSLALITQGWQFIWVPLMLACITVLNVMLGAVHERRRDIEVFSSVGLAPLHVAGIFLSETMVYAVVSSVIGYAFGIAGCYALVSAHALPEQFIPNFASTFVVIAVASVMSLTVLSTAYPAYKASKLVTPSVERRHRLKVTSVADELMGHLPFVASEDEVPGLMAYMKEYFEVFAVERAGRFATISPPVYKEETTKWSIVKSLDMKTALSPFDANVSQFTRFIASSRIGEYQYRLELFMRILTGQKEVWRKGVNGFTDLVRQQLLIWRGLKPDEKLRYMELGKQLVKSSNEGA